MHNFLTAKAVLDVNLVVAGKDGPAALIARQVCERDAGGRILGRLSFE